METRKLIICLIVTLMSTVYAVMKKVPIVGTVLRFYERLFWLVTAPVVFALRVTKFRRSASGSVSILVPSTVVSWAWKCLQYNAMMKSGSGHVVKPKRCILVALYDIARRLPVIGLIVNLIEKLLLLRANTIAAIKEFQKYVRFTVQLVCAFAWLEPAIKYRILMITLSYVLPASLYKKIMMKF